MRYEDVYNSNNIERFIAVLNSLSIKDCKVLDYGGGCGMLSCKLAASGYKVTLADQSQAALNAAKLLAKKQNVSIETLRVEDASSFEAESYDVIIMKDLVEHVVNDTQLVKDLSRSLRKNGLMLMTSQNINSLNYILEATVRKVLHPTKKWMGWDRTHLRFYSPKTMKMLAEASGLRLHKFDSAYIFPYKIFKVIPLPSFLVDRLYYYGFVFDKFLCNLFKSNKIGWNLMMISIK
jgi:2-polyprenyl-6-hydroxyphenyl methylase/3-demethylubiquinone-9 3-methyltransferase